MAPSIVRYRERGSQRVTRFLVVSALALVLAGAVLPVGQSTAAAGGLDWPQFDLNARHGGVNTQETTITRTNVARLHRLFQVALPSVADGAPAYLFNVVVNGAAHDTLFVTTKDGHIVALDAHTGAQLWINGASAAGCTINNGGTPCYTTSSPAADPDRAHVYSYGLDGYVHKYAVATGAEVTGGGWPELATRKPYDEKGSSALTVVTTRGGGRYLYVTNGGYPGDQGDYQGHVTTINLADSSQHVFNMACSNQVDVHFVEQPGTPDCPQLQTAVWARAGVVYDYTTDRIYLATGNGNYNPAAYGWGDSVLALQDNGTGAGGSPLDSYTPVNYQQLENTDADLGSTAPVLLSGPPGSTVAHLAVQGGKDAKLRLINRDNLSGQGGPGHTGGEVGPVISVPQGGEVLTAPAAWTNPLTGRTWVWVTNDNGISALRVQLGAGNVPMLQTMWQSGTGGASPIMAGYVLYYAGGNTIRALDPYTGALLWQDTIGGIHWQSPIVVNGVLYITDGNGKLTAYGL